MQGYLGAVNGQHTQKRGKKPTKIAKGQKQKKKHLEKHTQRKRYVQQNKTNF
jgi:hypothetical protein